MNCIGFFWIPFVELFWAIGFIISLIYEILKPFLPVIGFLALIFYTDKFIKYLSTKKLIRNSFKSKQQNNLTTVSPKEEENIGHDFDTVVGEIAEVEIVTFYKHKKSWIAFYTNRCKFAVSGHIYGLEEYIGFKTTKTIFRGRNAYEFKIRLTSSTEGINFYVFKDNQYVSIKQFLTMLNKNKYNY